MVSFNIELAISVLCLVSGASASKNAGANLPEKQFSQQFYDNFNNIKYFGGNGPYSDGRGYGISRDPPASCEVDQVMSLMRHGERFPDPDTYEKIHTSVKKLQNSNITFKDDLAFVNDWDFWIHNVAELGQETVSGPYSGLLDGYHRGAVYRDRYGHLWDGDSKVPIFASGYQRIIDTARRFGEGFFGHNYSEIASLNIISENTTQGAQSLTPTCYTKNTTVYDTCLKLKSDMPQFAVAAARLNAQNKGLKLNTTDIYNLMQMVGFELNARHSTPWTEVFTTEEWISFAYTQDLFYYYCFGPGNPEMYPIGSVYANATLQILSETESKNSLFFSFCHDTNITPVLAALGIFEPNVPLPIDGTVPFIHTYHSNDFVPMGGHLVIERLSCNASANSSKGKYVRLVVNEAVIPLDNCQSGPGFSCPLGNYTTYLEKRLPDYRTACKVPAEYPQTLDFFWKYDVSGAHNYQKGPVGFQAGFVDE